ncbi:MAG: tRNA preQ1(34) S-adenosylmethionine ribosyltransferase-isomerase QueA [Bacteroidetes bacterium QS_7_67_15]|jgi:S-adenosylmethionine:tRNA ribosyltransferase-isomerase|nr:MAG: tRNA preQ1(34) S-adenosylmethionine ribosyltransferase-isomerase QueA [Bacteroidetes bacterium QH_9_67_14]PSQ82455.1 MAG: tRNA preQ1(34) S-adenosylmethionine ribosyltransferase-isomerase QueA [Bacteroidetes bacterium QS_7_67_15]
MPTKLSEFDFEYPEELIAEYPAEPRDSCRLMVVDRAEEHFEHRRFDDLPDLLDPGDVLVINDTKVYPARLYGKKEKTGAQIEVFLLRELNSESRLWDVVVNPARKIRIGNKLFFEHDLTAEVIDNTTSRGRTIRFVFEGNNEQLYDKIDRIGETPLPDYIERDVEEADRERYQTIFAKHRGAIAAPAAGMHFTEALVERLRENGIHVVPITLHVGSGTFREIGVEDLTKHRMDSEKFTIPEETAETVNRALASDENSVTAVGTTVVRTLESSLSVSKNLKADERWTDEFIYPPYDFTITEQMITNLHPPRSSLVVMASAFTDFELLHEAYKEAYEKEYRLFTFGDAMLIR